MKRAALRKSLVAVAIFTVIFTSVPQALSATGSGTIIAGHPLTTNVSSTEYEFILRTCNIATLKTNGLDAWIIDMGSDTHLRAVGKISGTEITSGISFNVATYSSSCNYTGLALLHSPTNEIYVPISAKWAVVTLWSGANVALNWWTCSPSALIPTSCY